MHSYNSVHYQIHEYTCIYTPIILERKLQGYISRDVPYRDAGVYFPLKFDLYTARLKLHAAISFCYSLSPL